MDALSVLVLEDDPLLQTLLFEVFGEVNYQVSTATPDDCLSKVQTCVPDIIVVGCDGRGTFQRGWQVAHILRPVCPDSAIILLSTNWDAVQEVGHTSRGRNFDAGLRKPFAITELLQTLAVCHAARRNHQRHGSDEPSYENNAAAVQRSS